MARIEGIGGAATDAAPEFVTANAAVLFGFFLAGVLIFGIWAITKGSRERSGGS